LTLLFLIATVFYLPGTIAFLYIMGKKRVLCGYGIDIDAVAGFLGSYGGGDSTSDISRGV
jgi:hypothetical protein